MIYESVDWGARVFYPKDNSLKAVIHDTFEEVSYIPYIQKAYKVIRIEENGDEFVEAYENGHVGARHPFIYMALKVTNFVLLSMYFGFLPLIALNFVVMTMSLIERQFHHYVKAPSKDGKDEGNCFERMHRSVSDFALEVTKEAIRELIKDAFKNDEVKTI